MPKSGERRNQNFQCSALLFLVCIANSILSFGQVNLQTGSFSHSIPIYNYQDNKSGLNLPVALSYNSGNGLPVDEVASDVGQGWGLMAGGKIARIQVGEPDDQKAYGGEGTTENGAERKKYPNGYLFTNENAQQGVNPNYAKYPVFPYQNTVYKQFNMLQADRELDYFMLNVNGVSATFILQKGTNKGVFLGNTLMKIEFEAVAGSTQYFGSLPGLSSNINGNARTVISKFTLTDENGLKYIFETKAYTKVRRLAPSDRRFQNKVQAPKTYKKRQIYHETFFDDDDILNAFVVNEWYLTSIEDKFVSNRTIQFQYDYRNLVNNFTGFDYTTVNGKKEYGKVVAKRATVITPVIKSISCPNSYLIEFGYSDGFRLDVTEAKALQHIQVKYNGRSLQKHNLNHSYVIYTRYGTPATAEERLASRLYLLSVHKETVDLKDSEPPQTFDYYLGGTNRVDFVPPPFFASKDIWGYYDGFLSILGTTANDPLNVPVGYKSYCVSGSRGRIDNEFPSFTEIKRLTFKDEGLIRVKNGLAKNGLLKSISYAGGGKLMLEYEQRRAKFVNESTEQDVGGVVLSKTITYDDGSTNNCNAVALPTQYVYKNADGTSALWGMERPVNLHQTTSVYRAFDKKIVIKPLFYKSTCKWGFQYAGINHSDQAQRLNGYNEFMSSPEGEALSMAMDVYSTITSIKTIVAAIGSSTSFTVVMAYASIIIDVLLSVYLDIIVQCGLGNEKIFNVTTWYNSNLKASNALPIMYKRVEVLTPAGNNGKTVTEFTSSDDYPVWVPNNPLFNMQQRCGIWHYGLPKKTIIYDNSNKKVKEVINTYQIGDSCFVAQTKLPSPLGNIAFGTFSSGMQFCPNNKVPVDLYSCNVQAKKVMPLKSTEWDALKSSNAKITASNSELGISIYNHFTGRLELVKTEERTFERNNDAKYTTKITNYKYRYESYLATPVNFKPVEIEEIIPGGTNTLQRIFYNNIYLTLPAGNNHNDALNALRTNNVFTIPVFTETLVKKDGSSDPYKFISVNRVAYKIVTGGAVKQETMHVRRTTEPKTFVTEMAPEVKVSHTYYEFGANGLASAQQDESGRIVKSIYDYDDQFVVATCINLKNPLNESIAYNSFETANKHGFNFSGTTSLGNTITGAKFYQLTASHPITATISNPNTRLFTLSFWSTALVTVPNAGTPKIGPQRKGYTYYEYTIPTGVTSISISGTASIDELRLHPKGARMLTTTYDVALGKTSEADASGRVVNYEYDARGRLRAVKDEFGHIVKMYEYNERQQKNNCSTIFLSNAVYQVVQRNNCGANAVGEFAEYYLAAGAYSSTISQLHADLKAQQAVAANAQQYANSNAACKTVHNSDAMSKVFYRENCTGLQVGGAYTYSIPAGKYTSTISKQDANDQAEDDLEDMGQYYADSLGTCSTNNNPKWEGNENSPMQCNNGETEVQLTDINPNSPTYNQTQWWPMEENVLECTPGGSNPTQLVYQGPSSPEFIINFEDNTTGMLYSFSTHGPVGLYGELGPIPAGTYTVTFYPNFGSYNGYYLLETFESPGGLWTGSFWGYTQIYNVHVSGNHSYVNFNVY